MPLRSRNGTGENRTSEPRPLEWTLSWALPSKWVVSWELSWGVLENREKKISPCGRSRGHTHGPLVGPLDRDRKKGSLRKGSFHWRNL